MATPSLLESNYLNMRSILCFIFGLWAVAGAEAKIALPSIFSEHMVLQRNTEVTIWGWGHPGEEITLYTSWNGKEYAFKTSVGAKWEIAVETPEAGGPFFLLVRGNSNEIKLQNILIGEVWLCSGQSNMEWSANSGIDNAADEITQANYPNIRFFSVDKRASDGTQDDFSGTWEVCTPDTMQDFSAIAYFFARKIQSDLGIPIGLIDASWGASSAEVWTPARVFEEHDALKEAAQRIEENPWVTNKPSTLFNAMIHPITSFKIAGTLWYQGESNTANADTYQKLFSEMIAAWRSAWGYDFPFYFVQIAPYSYNKPEQGVLVRDAQRRSLEVPNTGMVVVSDICTVDDIHPRNKKDVGLRLANMALVQQYRTNENKVISGPLFKDMEIYKDKIIVRFHYAQGLYAKGPILTHFEIAGEDGVFFPAKAVLKEDQVWVSSNEVKHPKHVRFAWHNTAIPNLFNSAGLPASSFRSGL
ncbi:sialate O-acetylesterase [Arenibacter sp. GZD96]|uniref:sialate O-acetylesterase n=1 Tax=Aurantibrevibacter litoralis TaxID=3106030 RepID=UPI002AFF8108|nr:sialate O-acetylesterase [Arenibacter sp. GZD-96]MEA1787448.1 sialate O-acetylesterase [Arenibacter sp. GZD-96]